MSHQVDKDRESFYENVQRTLSVDFRAKPETYRNESIDHLRQHVKNLEREQKTPKLLRHAKAMIYLTIILGPIFGTLLFVLFWFDQDFFSALWKGYALGIASAMLTYIVILGDKDKEEHAQIPGRIAAVNEAISKKETAEWE